jgi:hypothetical protein
MRFFITKNIVCADSMVCGQALINKFKNKFPEIVIVPTDKISSVNGHISISHKSGEHKIWIFVYDQDNIHESESEGLIKKVNNSRCKKPLIVMPKLADVERSLL